MNHVAHAPARCLNPLGYDAELRLLLPDGFLFQHLFTGADIAQRSD
jgi:hypothetical protein